MGPVARERQQRESDEEPEDQGRDGAQPAAGVGAHTATPAAVTRRSWKIGEHRVGVEPRGVEHVVAKTQLARARGPPLPEQGALPVLAVAADEIECRERGIIEPAPRLAAPERRRHQPPRAVGVVEREDAVPAGADDQQVLVPLEDLVRLSAAGVEVDRRRRIHRRRALAGEQRLGAVGRGEIIVLPRTPRARSSPAGLLPRGNPGSAGTCFSPARSTSSLPSVWARRSASSVEATGMTARAPWASAAHIEVRGAEDVDHEDRPALNLRSR